jgi:hypothetical protein
LVAFKSLEVPSGGCRSRLASYRTCSWGRQAGGYPAGTLPAGCTGRACPLTGLRLRLPPGVTVIIALPVRFTYSCYEPGGWTSPAGLQVHEQFGPFTHLVAIAFPVPYLLREPEPAGPGTTCPR